MKYTINKYHNIMKIDNNPNNKLLKSYMDGDIKLFRKLILDNENVNCLNSYNRSLISLVIENKEGLENNKEFFDELISAGVCLNQIGWESGLLAVAVEFQKQDIYYAKKLLDNKINIDSVGVYYFSHDNFRYGVFEEGEKFPCPYGPAIFDALTYSSIKHFDLFLKYNPDINLLNDQGDSLLHNLIGECQQNFNQDDMKNIFETLLERGADPGIRNKYGKNVLNLIITNHQNFLINSLFEKAHEINIDARNQRGDTALNESIESNNIEASYILINLGANSNLYNVNEQNALIKSMLKNNQELFIFLIEKGADISSIGKESGSNILHILTSYDIGHDFELKEFYKLILNKAPELMHKKNKYGKTPIDILKENGWYEARRGILNQYESKSIENLGKSKKHEKTMEYD